jgi:hypothetical protein
MYNVQFNIKVKFNNWLKIMTIDAREKIGENYLRNICHRVIEFVRLIT